MNNYEDFSDSIHGDIDIAIDKKIFKLLDRILLSISIQHNVEVVQKIWHGYNKCAYILSPFNLSEPFRIQLDFFVDFSAKGYMRLIPPGVMLRNRRKFKFFYVPASDIETVFLLTRRIVKNDFNGKHLGKLNELVSRDPVNIKKRIINYFGQEIGDELLKVIQNGDVLSFRNNIKHYRSNLKKLSRYNTSLKYRIQYYLSEMKRVIHRILNPVGMMVVFLGPDGSGKTTIAKKVTHLVGGIFHGNKLFYWRPNLYEQLGIILGLRKPVFAGVNPNPHGHKPQGKLKSIIRFLYYVPDFIVGYYVKVFPLKVRKYFCVFDRYYYDYFVDLYRYQFNISKILPKLFYFFIPKPELVFYLDCEPKVLCQRKRELPIYEIERQAEAYRSLKKFVPNFYVINNNLPLDDVVQEIAAIILKTKAAKTEKILKLK